MTLSTQSPTSSTSHQGFARRPGKNSGLISWPLGNSGISCSYLQYFTNSKTRSRLSSSNSGSTCSVKSSSTISQNCLWRSVNGRFASGAAACASAVDSAQRAVCDRDNGDAEGKWRANVATSNRGAATSRAWDLRCLRTIAAAMATAAAAARPLVVDLPVEKSDDLLPPPHLLARGTSLLTGFGNGAGGCRLTTGHASVIAIVLVPCTATTAAPELCPTCGATKVARERGAKPTKSDAPTAAAARAAAAVLVGNRARDMGGGAANDGTPRRAMHVGSVTPALPPEKTRT
mmetsp:Transcript_14098/g.38597  ORF Transcript_14098/g.38597 Transcript_14098/m.38597 type:complete len:289 (+) Transcript_14098:708-1574(+)